MSALFDNILQISFISRIKLCTSFVNEIVGYMTSKDSLKNLTVQLLWDAGYISGSFLSPQPQNMEQLIQFIEAFPAEQPIAMDQIPETFESALFHLAGFDRAAFNLAKKYIATKLLSGAGLSKPGYQFSACLVAGWVPRWSIERLTEIEDLKLRKYAPVIDRIGIVLTELFQLPAGFVGPPNAQITASMVLSFVFSDFNLSFSEGQIASILQSDK